MIFITVGVQLPFDRLVKSMDRWAATTKEDIFGQIGDGAQYFPKHFRFSAYLTPSELDYELSRTSLIVGHAGMGTLLEAATRGLTMIAMPRRADLGEHRNDHQMTMARRFPDRKDVRFVYSESELYTALEEAAWPGKRQVVSQFAPADTIDALRSILFIFRRGCER